MTKPTPAEAWLKKYYPTPANKATKTELQAAKHSLRKWRGLLPHNRKGLCLNLRSLIDSKNIEVLFINCKSCALCERHTNSTGTRIDCDSCILYKSTGLTCIDNGSQYCNFTSAYTWKETNNAIRKMVKALTGCVRVLQRKSKKP